MAIGGGFLAGFAKKENICGLEYRRLARPGRMRTLRLIGGTRTTLREVLQAGAMAG